VAETKINLVYGFPDIGNIHVTLNDESAHLYRYLERQGEISRLEHLDHLGILREVHKSAHYSRWEYVMLQLYFVEILSSSSEVLGIRQSVDVDQVKFSSGEELVKCWIILLNASHLKSVFDFERAWFEYLLDSPEFKDVFIAALPSDKSRDAAKAMFEAENYYKLHKFLGLLALFHWRKYDSKNRYPWEHWIKAIESTLVRFEPGQKLHTIRDFFERIRKLAFISLDLAHCPLGIRFNPALLVQNIKQSPKGFFYEEDNPLMAQLDTLQPILFTNIYAAQNVVLRRHCYIAGQKSHITRLVGRRGKGYFVESPEIFCERINSARKDDYGKTSIIGADRHYLRLILLPDDLFPVSLKYYSDQKWLAKTSGKENWMFIITPTAFSNLGGCMVDVVKPKIYSQIDEVNVLWATAKYIMKYFSEYRYERILFDIVIRQYVEQLFMFILGRFLKETFRAKMDAHTSPNEFTVNYVESTSIIKDWKKTIRYDMKNGGLKKSRKWELEAMMPIVSREKKGSLLLSLCDVRVFSEMNEPVCEFDSVYFVILKHSLKVVIVEAKGGISRKSEKAKEALKEKIGKVMRIDGMPKIIRREGCAYTEIKFGSRSDIVG